MPVHRPGEPPSFPALRKKKGTDSGIDGIIYFKPDGKTTEKAIVSVKGGENVGVRCVAQSKALCVSIWMKSKLISSKLRGSKMILTQWLVNSQIDRLT